MEFWSQNLCRFFNPHFKSLFRIGIENGIIVGTGSDGHGHGSVYILRVVNQGLLDKYLTYLCKAGAAAFPAPLNIKWMLFAIFL